MHKNIALGPKSCSSRGNTAARVLGVPDENPGPPREIEDCRAPHNTARAHYNIIRVPTTVPGVYHGRGAVSVPRILRGITSANRG